MSKPIRCAPRGNAALIQASAIVSTGQLQTPGVDLSSAKPTEEKSADDQPREVAPDAEPVMADKSPDQN